MKPPNMAAERTEVPVLKLKVTEALSKDVGRAIARMGMGRRDCKLSDAMAELIQYVHEQTKAERSEAIKKARG